VSCTKALGILPWDDSVMASNKVVSNATWEELCMQHGEQHNRGKAVVSIGGSDIAGFGKQ